MGGKKPDFLSYLIYYCTGVLGSRADCLEIAIAGYQLVLTGFPRKHKPEKWAQTPNNLAIAYRNRIRGERAQNLEKAISAYEAALGNSKK